VVMADAGERRRETITKGGGELSKERVREAKGRHAESFCMGRGAIQTRRRKRVDFWRAKKAPRLDLGAVSLKHK